MPRFSYSTYRAALRIDGKTVALLTPDGRNAFSQDQIKPLLDVLNALDDTTTHDLAVKLTAEQPG
jgi:hypothetical protein